MELGTGYDYTAIAAVLVGGTAIQGGSGSVMRTLARRHRHRHHRGACCCCAASASNCNISSPGSSCSASSCCTPSASGVDGARPQIPAGPVDCGRSPSWLARSSCSALMDRGHGYFFNLGTVFSVMQLFATFGLVALGLGLSMLVREFDLSVAGMVGLAGCIAVMTGVENPWLGVVLGVGAGVVSGVLQGLIMTRLGLSSVGVTLGGLLTLAGHHLRADREQDHQLSQHGGGARTERAGANLLSVRSAAALAVFVLAALVMAYTHIGRDVIATGSDRRASRIAGLNTDRVIIGVFAASGASAALAGVLLSYSLGAASPVALADVLAPAAAAAIVGGVSVVGGRGTPMGIAAGVLTLCILRSGLTAIGVEPHVHDLVTGVILISIAVLDAPELTRRVTAWRLDRAERQALQGNRLMSDQPPSSYDFVPLPDRAPLKFPDGAHVALIFTINIEYWEPSRPGQKEPLFAGGPATIPHALPGDVLDTANWTWREYGQRIGIWRVMDVFDAMGIARPAPATA